MMEPVALERGYYEDIDEVLALYRACALNAEINGSSDWDEDYPTYEMVEFDLDERALFVVRRAGKIIATVSVLTRGEHTGERNDWTQAPMACVLSRLCVLPEYQRHGLGSWVVELVCEYACKLGCQSIRLLVPSKNIPALQMFHRLGFHSNGIRILYGATYLMFERLL